MKASLGKAVLTLLVVLTLAGCASTPPTDPSRFKYWDDTPPWPTSYFFD